MSEKVINNVREVSGVQNGERVDSEQSSAAQWDLFASPDLPSETAKTQAADNLRVGC